MKYCSVMARMNFCCFSQGFAAECCLMVPMYFYTMYCPVSCFLLSSYYWLKHSKCWVKILSCQTASGKWIVSLSVLLYWPHISTPNCKNRIKKSQPQKVLNIVWKKCCLKKQGTWGWPSGSSLSLLSRKKGSVTA